MNGWDSRPISGWLAVILLCSLGILPPTHAQIPRDPNFLQPDIQQTWKTAETAHFRIHYEARNEAYVLRMGSMAERVHDRLSGWLKWQPKEKTELVILDNADFSNGYASPIPYNRFSIFLPTPVEGQLVGQDAWLETVLTHEYIHTLQLDMAEGAPEKVRDVFGRLNNLFSIFVFPQIFAPSWVTEGLSVYGESDNAEQHGRLNSAWYDAQMRMEVTRGLRSLTELSFEGYSGSRWPFGQIYLYGAYFFEFIEARYGRNKIQNYIQIYSSNLIPWRMDNRSQRVFGKPAEEVWREYQDYLKSKFKIQLEQIARKGRATTKTLHDRQFINRFLTASSEGDLYFFHDDASSHPVVQRLRQDGSLETLFEFQGVVHLDWHDQSGLLISRRSVCDNLKLYTDLYRWRPGDGEPKRLTHCGRYPRAAWHPDGSEIAAVLLEQSSSKIVLLDAQGEVMQTITPSGDNDVIGHIAWSPDGLELVAAVKGDKDDWNLELLNVDRRQWWWLTRSKDVEIRPQFSADGRKVYFLSDRNGVWNLRQLVLATGEVSTLSNTLSAIAEAQQMPDEGFRLVEYQSDGEAIIALTDNRPVGESYPAIDTAYASVAPGEERRADESIAFESISEYSPLNTLKPTSWFPLLSLGEDETSYAGVIIGGADVLGFHRWSALPVYYLDQQTLGGFAEYSFDDRVIISYQREYQLSGSDSAARRFLDDEIRLQLLVRHAFNSVDRTLSVAGGVARETIDRELNKGSGSDYQLEDALTGIILGYDDSEYYRHGISFMDGRQINLTTESYDLFGQSDHEGATARLDWREYLSLGDGHALKVRLMLAQGDDGIRPYELGGESEPLSELGGATGLGRRVFPLRGFASGNHEMTGTNLGMASVEWRMPLGLYYDGWFVPPLGLGRHSLSLFVDSGDAWNGVDSREFHTGIGIEWKGEVLIGYDLIHAGVTVGVAHGFGTLGENRLYLQVGLPL